ncbi:pollen receptor-like kinase 3 [Prunus yedoensis var. nudiflora]|uniref:Pollen receptor-like kinase 3 n=1 Tax=Prunus yedoensis var. nudiflora TaxID=2094558 RepID=A0A314XFM0_PRUYE|nr:pollen receptor-like kinase 3 [Prunus yedoensis var. nudiflora]
MAATRFFDHRPHHLLFSSIIFFVLPCIAYSIAEPEALLKLKESFKNVEALNSWTPDTTPCARNTQWAGLICANGIVTGLRLGGMGLAGEIDTKALAEIKGLRTMSFVNNNFSGPMPEFNTLGPVKGLYLSGNQFTGEISSNFFVKMESLRKLWLSNNKFTGNIPPSLATIPNLLELHLEDNGFSGSIPVINQSTLVSLNMSNNKLEGEVPASMLKFKASSFAGNAGLCGGNLGKECAKPEPPPVTSTTPNDINNNGENGSNSKGNGGSSKVVVAVSVASAVVLVALIVLFFVKSRRKEDEADFDMPGKENTEKTDHPDAVELNVSEIKQKEVVVDRPSSSKRAGNSSRKGSNNGKGGGGMAELVMLNEEKGVFGLPDLMKAAAEVLGNGGLGSSYKAVMANGFAVVVKRMREMNGMGKDGFDAEMRRFGSLRHWNILTPLAYHYRKEEKLLIYEYIPKSSLLYILHGDRGPSHAELDWPARLKIVQGTAKGLAYIHTEFASCDVPHGNLKSSNILLGPDYEPLLSDFAFGPLINTANVAQALFAYKAPEAAEHDQVSPKCDVYCLGIIILEIMTGKFPSQYLNNGKGGLDVIQWVRSAISEGRESELLDPEISSTNGSLGEMEKLLHIGAACTESNPNQRLDMGEAITRIEQVQVLGSDSVPHTKHAPTLREGVGELPEVMRLESNVIGTRSGRLGGDDDAAFSIS